VVTTTFASHLGPAERAQAWRALGEGEFDVLVVGGGVTGTGAALDAATRGLRTALVEARDRTSRPASRCTTGSGERGRCRDSDT
jgi:glycerol-3-phosphate dehydrogenase